MSNVEALDRLKEIIREERDIRRRMELLDVFATLARSAGDVDAANLAETQSANLKLAEDAHRELFEGATA